MNILDDNQTTFLKTNYPIHGSNFCAAYLGMTMQQVRRKANRLKLKILPTTKSLIQKINSNKRKSKNINSYKVNAKSFFLPTKITAYLLGMLWADGSILKKDHRISLELVIDDLNEIHNLFKSTGEWRFHCRQRSGRRQQGTLSTTNKPLYNFLVSLDYDKKSYYSADKVIDYLPENLHSYWFRGYFDGDGCFYLNKRHYCNQMTIAGSYSQNWSFAETLMNKLNIKYSTSKRIQKCGRSSIVRITNKMGIVKFGQYIYGEGKYDGIGFIRKYDKYLKIKTQK